tara:strand:+ start:59 stop:346 length:288 start_codon:yes stop_codon:yes gene_type:complete
MKAIEYFNKIEEFANLKDKEGFEAFEKCLYGLNKEDLLELIVEFTSIIAKADVSLDIIEDPFETGNDWDKVSEEDKIAYKEKSKLHNKSHLKIVH